MTRLRCAFFVVPAALVAGACSSFGETPPPSATDGGADPNPSGDASVDGVAPPTSPPGTAPPNTPPPGTPPPVDAGYGCPPPGDAAATCPDSGIVWNGRCYFATGGFNKESFAPGACAAAGAQLATFTCAAEWQHAHPVGGSNYWFGASYDNGWTWLTAEPFLYTAPGFDAAPPSDPVATCLLSVQGNDWQAAECGASGTAYCEK